MPLDTIHCRQTAKSCSIWLTLLELCVCHLCHNCITCGTRWTRAVQSNYSNGCSCSASGRLPCYFQFSIFPVAHTLAAIHFMLFDYAISNKKCSCFLWNPLARAQWVSSLRIVRSDEFTFISGEHSFHSIGSGGCWREILLSIYHKLLYSSAVRRCQNGEVAVAPSLFLHTRP